MNQAVDFNVSTHPAFELVRTQPIESLAATLQEYRHRVTGARHYHLAADSEENVFMVALRTQPMDSTGVAHVLEHTVLCGSKRYPVRDPFFSMIKRSLNTFMNAFTSADWTAYPFATQNRQDFDNLLSVYLDAVFFPNLDPLDFAQEGIRVELDEHGKPLYKGIVFNEMKGAMSNPNDQLYHTLAEHLYPTTTYHHNSGGDPAQITRLTHQDLLDFHRQHYHPSNAVFMTFGNIPADALHRAFEDQALGQYGVGEALQSTPEQRHSAPLRIEATYAVDEPDLTEKTHHVLAWLLGEMTDTASRLALRLLSGVLLEDSAAPLRHYLETCGLGQSPAALTGLEDSNFEMAFMCGLAGSEPEHAEAFEAGVLAVLEQVASNPPPARRIEAVLHQIELSQREIGGDGMPYGLGLLLSGLNAAIHGGDPLSVWALDPLLAQLREQVKHPDFVPDLIRRHLLDNPHRVRLTLRPDAQKSQRDHDAEQAQLTELAAQLDADGQAALRESAQRLAERQALVDDIELLPKVGLADVPAELHIAQGTTVALSGQDPTRLHRYAAGTNGLYYQKVLMALPAQVLAHPHFEVYCGLLGELGAGALDYLQVQELQTEQSGGISAGTSNRTALDTKAHFTSWLMISTKALVNRPEAMGLLHTLWCQMRFDEGERILELLRQRHTRWKSRIANAGHGQAMLVANRAHSPLAALEYQTRGLPALKALGQLLEKIEQDAGALGELQGQLQALHQVVQQLPREHVLVAPATELDALQAVLAGVWGTVPDQHPAAPMGVASPADQACNADVAQSAGAVDDLAWLVQTNVQFCAASYAAVPQGHSDAAALMVLGPYLRNSCLHRLLREQGGAYGGGASYDPNAAAFVLYSYRDPRLQETFADFDASIAFMQQDDHEPRWLEEAILGLMASMDKPGSPAGEAISACIAQLHGRTPAVRQRFRQQLLAVTLEDLRRVTADYLHGQKPVRAVLAPHARRTELAEMGFVVDQL